MTVKSPATHGQMDALGAVHLLLRTMDRAQRIYLAMLCRGFDGEIRIMKPLKFRSLEIGFVCGWSALFVFMRFCNVPTVVGSVIMEFL